VENKANYHLIGAFVIISMVSLFIFLIWLAKIDFDQEYKDYDIYFAEAVDGLTKASKVTYNGIPVGEVRDISLPVDDPSKVLVLIRIKDEIPILEDTVATLGMQGITGVLFVQIVGGHLGSPELVAEEGQDRPVIPSRPSTLEEFFGGGGDLIKGAMQTFEQLNKLLSTENIERISQSLENVKNLSSDLAAEGETIKQTLEGLLETIKTVEALIKEDISPAADELQTLSKNGNKLIKNLDLLITENKGNIANFTGKTMLDMNLLIADMRELTQTMEENPTDLIMNRPEPEYEVEK